MTRKEFLKKIGIGMAGAAAVVGMGSVPVVASVGQTSSEGNIVSGAVAPADHTKMWLNTGSGQNQAGIDGRAVPAGALCYFDVAGNGWKPTTATWG